MRRLIPIAAALAVLAFLVWAFLPRAVEVELAEVAARPLEVAVEEEGEARIREVFTVSATIAGKLQRIGLHAGDEVSEGQPVASIGPAAPVLLDSRARAVAEAAAAAAQAATDLARAQLAQAEANRDFAQGEANRAVALFQKGAMSARAYDTAIREQKTAEAAVSSAVANLAVREKELESAVAMLRSEGPGNGSFCCVDMLAPVSGKVLRVLTESEQVVQPGTPILELGDPGNLEIVVELLSRDAVRVAEGAAATVYGWGGPSVAAVVERVEPSAVTRVSALGIDEQRVTVVLRLTGAAGDWQGLGHGFRVIARIALWREEGVLTIPVGALFRDGPDWATYAVRDGRAEVQRITLGERNEDFAQVLDGLAAGDRVILHPSDQVTAGVSVAPVPGQ
ncbi:MAG: HlyD family efflux transporter periplasmic adaptor subunit [Tabrizicola sp.]|uniref:efflux RND transporter periplasmic adaptor subunit n=1 Tax=Tabrizicola sp. TaxID=2005166 RepID=UPI002AB84196|nr:HlyD family efflux transporter periplasmic adaptor subunit [Tabrizicola sp.]MDZ4087395.1 HlyD family efflux transporter periplasmic adaptor subunit [Tabrizicola sp.]